MSVLGAENTRNQETLRTLASATTVPAANPPHPQAMVAETNVVPPISKTVTAYPVTNLKLSAIVGKSDK